MSQVTTHVLDTSRGKPAWGITVFMYQKVGREWIQYAKGITSKEGRITNLLDEDQKLPLGTYKITFDTLHYFDTMDVECFYPIVEIIFDIKTAEHYHIPLLISPYAYSTYRGS
ncbi:MAG: hydroxyisourate hydrolase [Ferruginibacter sp.]